MRVGQNCFIAESVQTCSKSASLDHVDLKFWTYLKHVQTRRSGAPKKSAAMHISTHKLQGVSIALNGPMDHES